MPRSSRSVRAAGAAVRLISDGDVAGVIATTDPATGIDIYLGIGRRAGRRAGGGGAALRRRADADPPRFPDRRRARPAPGAWASADLNRKYSLTDLASGDVIFAATGVTDGSMLAGVRRERDQVITESVVMRSATRHRALDQGAAQPQGRALKDAVASTP